MTNETQEITALVLMFSGGLIAGLFIGAVITVFLIRWAFRKGKK